MAALKYSRQREAIKEFLSKRTDHPTADVVYENIRQIYPNISMGTVYRNLSLLSDIGEIQKVPGLSGADHFDWRTDAHCHFLCRNCRRVIDMNDTGIQQLLESAESRYPGIIDGCRVSFSGICEDCMHPESGIHDA
ncbi:MAG: transcriptional repressor [Blautia sp.]|nr:transcriptional repressor [Blautia sp.]